MKKVLFIYYYFPPLLGGWRAIGSTVQYLQELGWQPTVLSAAETVSYPKDYDALKKVPPDIPVHRISHPEYSRLWLAGRRKLHLNMDFPDHLKKSFRPFLDEARKTLNAEKFDLIFTYGPPATLYFVGMQLKKEFGIPWIPFFGDLWSENILSGKLVEPLHMIQANRVKKAEKTLINHADAIMVRCWEQQRLLQRLYGLDPNKIYVVLHGYDRDDHKSITPSRIYPTKTTITYTGTFYDLYTQPFIHFLQALNRVNPDAEVVLIGPGAGKVQGNNLTRILFLPQEKALSFAAGSDFLLSILPENVKWTMMKLYDYLYLNKPILALVPEDGDVAHIITKAGAGFVLSYNPSQMENQLQKIFSDWQSSGNNLVYFNHDYIAGLDRKNITRQIANVFDQVSRQ